MSSLLPSSATPFENALGESIARVSNVPTPARQAWNPDTCPVELLPWMAWAFSVDAWDANWNDAQKRQAIKTAVAVQKYKGTIGAVKDALSALGIGVRVQEWFNQIPAGAPYTYRLLIDVDQVGVSQAAFQKAVQIVENTKNLRSHLDTIAPNVQSSAEVFISAAALSGNSIAYTQAASALIANGLRIADGSRIANGFDN